MAAQIIYFCKNCKKAFVGGNICPNCKQELIKSRFSSIYWYKCNPIEKAQNMSEFIGEYVDPIYFISENINYRKLVGVYFSQRKYLKDNMDTLSPEQQESIRQQIDSTANQMMDYIDGNLLAKCEKCGRFQFVGTDECPECGDAQEKVVSKNNTKPSNPSVATVIKESVSSFKQELDEDEDVALPENVSFSGNICKVLNIILGLLCISLLTALIPIRAWVRSIMLITDTWSPGILKWGTIIITVCVLLRTAVHFVEAFMFSNHPQRRGLKEGYYKEFAIILAVFIVLAINAFAGGSNWIKGQAAIKNLKSMKFDEFNYTIGHMMDNLGKTKWEAEEVDDNKWLIVANGYSSEIDEHVSVEMKYEENEDNDSSDYFGWSVQVKRIKLLDSGESLDNVLDITLFMDWLDR